MLHPEMGRGVEGSVLGQWVLGEGLGRQGTYDPARNSPRRGQTAS
jgi:hypothetical protein